MILKINGYHDRAAQDHAAIMELVQELHAKHDAAHGVIPE